MLLEKELKNTLIVTIQQDRGTDIWINVYAPVRSHYLLVFQNMTTGEQKNCICENIDVLTLAFVETDTDDALNGKLALRPSGDWFMASYLQPVGSESTNLDETLAQQIESQRIIVEY